MQIVRMGSDNHAAVATGLIKRPKTALLILVLLRDAIRPLTTYEIGLEVSDDQCPPRPISVIVKNLSKDGYIASSEKAGKRLRFWHITKRGLRSIRLRDCSTVLAQTHLALAPARSEHEMQVERAMASGHIDPRAIARHTGLKSSIIKTCLKRAEMRRGLVKVA